VPFSVEGDRSYYRRREIIDAAAFVRCVLDPNDLTALVGALRSPAVGVPDAAWVPLFSRRLPERVARLERPDTAALRELAEDVEAVATALPKDIPGLERIAGWQANLLAALEAIASLRETFETQPADVFVEELRAVTLLEATEAARFLGSWRVANLERFFRDLTEELAAGADVQQVLRRLRHAVAEEEEMAEEPPHDAAADAVQILTLHGAKGLDFDHVYLMQLHKGTGQRPGPRIDAARIDGTLELRLLGAPTPGFDRVASRRDQVADAERVRLLYVGMTRARERLVLCGAWPAFLQQKRRDTHAALLEQRQDLPDLRALLAEAGGQGRSAVDAGGARFVLPALRPEAPLAQAKRSPAEHGRGSAGAVAPIGVRRREAEQRMARPLAGWASGAADPADPEQRAQGLSGTPGPRAERSAASPARLAGTAVHRLFESLDLSRPVSETWPEHRARLEPTLRGLAPESDWRPAAELARGVVEGLAGGTLLARLERIRHHVLARELPVLLPAGEDDAALGFVSGSVDLVYRDPDDGAFVVVDLKTDAVSDGHELSARVASYRHQAALYQRALREGLSLERDPRIELWFLALDRSVSPGDEVVRAPEQMSLTLG